jgi:hypothetical protein
MEVEWARYASYLREELPPSIQHELETTLDDLLGGVEESLRTLLPEIFRQTQLQLLQRYTEMRNRESTNTTGDEQPVINNSMTDWWPDVNYSSEFGIYLPTPNFFFPDVERDARSGEPVFEDGLRSNTHLHANLGNAGDCINPLTLHQQDGLQRDKIPDAPVRAGHP